MAIWGNSPWSAQNKNRFTQSATRRHPLAPFHVKSAEFIKSAPGIKDAPDFNGLPEIVFVGRSNVGKSSVINSLLQRKNLAKTSNTPGKTRLINFYLINEALVLVDLPGYGYAKVSHAEQESWRIKLEQFLTQREPLQLVIHLIDIRHGPQPSDIQMFEWLNFHQLPALVILTKTDKLTKSQVVTQTKKSAQALGLALEDVIPYSAVTHAQRDLLWKRINASQAQATHD